MQFVLCGVISVNRSLITNSCGACISRHAIFLHAFIVVYNLISPSRPAHLYVKRLNISIDSLCPKYLRSYWPTSWLPARSSHSLIIMGNIFGFYGRLMHQLVSNVHWKMCITPWKQNTETDQQSWLMVKKSPSSCVSHAAVVELWSSLRRHSYVFIFINHLAGASRAVPAYRHTCGYLRNLRSPIVQWSFLILPILN